MQAWISGWLHENNTLNTVGYVCYLKELNEQTTAASNTEEQEYEEWEENERDEEKRERSSACAHLGLCCVCHGSVPQMKMRGGKVRWEQWQTRTDWASPVEAAPPHTSQTAPKEAQMLREYAAWLQSHRWMQMYLLNIFLHAWKICAWVMPWGRMTSELMG